MSVSSFTNSVGSHQRVENRPRRTDGVLLGNPFHVETPHDVITGYSYKSPTVKGDHDGPLPYTREIMNVIRDIPFKYKEVLHDGSGGVIWDLDSSEYLSQKFPTSVMLAPPAFYSDMSNAYDASITKALDKLRENRAQIGAAIFEARKTVEMISDTTKSVLYAYKAVRRGNFQLALKHLGVSGKSVRSGVSASSAWLQYIYGWLPLLGDIEDGCNRLASGYRDKGFIIVAKSVPRVSYEEPFSGGDYASRWLAEGGVKTQLEARITNSFLDSIDGSGVLNPLSVAWELVPFSFIVDWFVPVGNVLESLTASAGLELAAGFTSQFYDTSFQSSVRSYGDGIVVKDPGEFNLRQFRFQREVHGTFPMPRLYAKNNPFTSSHLTSAVALIRSLAGNSSR
jgi:hypothetical protein